jgi:hypothetical protein
MDVDNKKTSIYDAHVLDLTSSTNFRLLEIVHSSSSDFDSHLLYAACRFPG